MKQIKQRKQLRKQHYGTLIRLLVSYVYYNKLHVAVYDGCGSVAFVYWLRLSPIHGCDILGALWGIYA